MRRYSRRGLLRIGAAGDVALAAGGVLSPSAAAAPAVLLTSEAVAGSALRPFGRHLAFGADPSRQIVVSWQTPAKVTAPYLRIGTVAGELGEALPAEVRALTSDLTWQTPDHTFSPHLAKAITQYYLHVRLDNLVPNTTYYYVVGHQGYDPTTSGRIGEVATFRTAPGPASTAGFSFTAFGDRGVNYNALATNSLIADLAPRFHLAMGDMSYALNGEGGHPQEDLYDARKWDAFFQQNEVIAAGIPWMVALGNHEMEGWYDNHGYGGMRARFSMPDNAWDGSTCVYSWRYQNVGLISLDSNDICNRNSANLDHTRGKQLAWLDAQLKALRADRTIDFIVVHLHHATYSTPTPRPTRAEPRASRSRSGRRCSTSTASTWCSTPTTGSTNAPTRSARAGHQAGQAARHRGPVHRRHHLHHRGRRRRGTRHVLRQRAGELPGPREHRWHTDDEVLQEEQRQPHRHQGQVVTGALSRLQPGGRGRHAGRDDRAGAGGGRHADRRSRAATRVTFAQGS